MGSSGEAESAEAILPKELKMEVGGKTFVFKEFGIGRIPEGGVVSPGNMETGSLEEIDRLYNDQSALVSQRFPGMVEVPYAFLAEAQGKVFGDYTKPAGQDEFKDSDLVITKAGFNPPAWAKELWQLGKLRRRKKFSLDSKLACIRGLEIKDGHLVFTVGEGLYSQSFYSNGMEGISLGVSEKERAALIETVSPAELEELERLAAELEQKYGEGKTIREAVFSHQSRLPEFGEQVHNNSIGVAGMVLTPDQEFIFVRRGGNVSINQGINCTASGAVEFDEATLSRHGLPVALGESMDQETRSELGFNAGALLLGSMQERIELELGLSPADYEIIPVGFIRELPRGGKPECMFLIRTKDSTTEVVRKIIHNPNAEKKEIEGSVYAVSAQDTESLLRTRAKNQPIQHKGAVNLILALEYLRNNRG